MPCCGDATHCQDWACAVQLKENYSFRPGPATPCLKTGCADGGQKSSKLLRKINTEKVLGFLKPNSEFTIHQVSETWKGFKGLFPHKDKRGAVWPSRAPGGAGRGTGARCARQRQRLAGRRLRFLQGNPRECIHLTGTTQSCCSIYWVNILI